MSPRGIPYENIAGIPPLFADYARGEPRLEPFLPAPFRTPQEHLARAARLASRPCPRPWPRGVLAERLVAHNRDLGADGAALASAAALGEDGTFAVVAGQQAGPYTGPLYTLYKALTAALLAGRLNELNRSAGGDLRFVPLFWCASEDHDLDEINHLDLPCPGGTLRRLSSGIRTTGAPASSVLVDDGILRFHREVVRALPPNEFRDDAAAALAPEPGESLARWFSRCLAILTRGMGVALVDPGILRDLSAPLFERAVRSRDEIDEALEGARERLRSLGYTPVLDGTRRLHLFRIEAGGRRRIEQAGRRVDPARLAREILDDPDAFSADVVLRPVLQSYLLPATTLVAGPSEVAYLAEIAPVFGVLDVPAPVVLPRASATLMTPRQGRALARFGLEPEDLTALARLEPPPPPEAGPPGGARGEPLPPSLAAPLARLSAALGDGLAGIREAIVPLDPGAVPSVERAGRRMEEGLARLGARLREVVERSRGAGRARWARLRAELHPRGRLQERVLGPLPFLARHGPGLPGRVARGIDVFDFRHRILDPGGEEDPS